jgi:predicted nucleotidyltransferase
MRLTESERRTILQTAKEIFGGETKVRLFGSRVDEQRRGGDIDLHLEVAGEKATLKNEMLFELELIKRLGERKFDVVLHKSGEKMLPIDEIALRTGLLL